uniref:ribosomal protein S15 n=1 Tax=Melocactus glaucescens TaxID=2775423 RepID=UPI00286B4FF5|nr:ribosomal protein S15 [Melocactus glaucescens]WKK45486.1 ribosomal protein S15 [Melocactus glaucescens]
MKKKSFIPVISHEENRGSVEFQVFRFSNRIIRLTAHLKLHKKDYSSEIGIRKILGKRQRLLDYLWKKDKVRHKKLISQLKKAKIKIR